MNIEFKKAEYEDVEGIITLCNVCFGENTDLEAAEKVFIENNMDENQIYVIGVLEGEIVAHAKISIIPTIYDKMGTYAILNHVCVKPEYRREHIGTKLLDECFKIAKKHKCKAVELWSGNQRVPAHALYHKYGFDVMDAKFFTKDVK